MRYINRRFTYLLTYLSFVSQLNSKIPVSGCLCFCLLKLRQNAFKLIILGTKMIFFWGGVQPFHNTPFPSAPTAPRNLLTEMLNTPLQPRLVGRIMFSACPFVCRLRKCEHDVLNTHRVRLHLAASLLHLLCNQKLHRRLVQPIELVDRLSVFKKSLSDDFFFSQGDF